MDVTVFETPDAARGALVGVRHTQLAELLWEDVESAAKNVAKAGTPQH